MFERQNNKGKELFLNLSFVILFTMAEVGAILRKQQEKLGELLCKKTHFLPTEIQGLLNVHRRLQMTPKSNDRMSGHFSSTK